MLAKTLDSTQLTTDKLEVSTITRDESHGGRVRPPHCPSLSAAPQSSPAYGIQEAMRMQQTPELCGVGLRRLGQLWRVCTQFRLLIHTRLGFRAGQIECYHSLCQQCLASTYPHVVSTNENLEHRVVARGDCALVSRTGGVQGVRSRGPEAAAGGGQRRAAKGEGRRVIGSRTPCRVHVLMFLQRELLVCSRQSCCLALYTWT